jgi:hypothetical protein
MRSVLCKLTTGLNDVSGTAKNFIDIGERLVNLPAKERQYYRAVLTETYRLLDTAILIPITRLDKMLTIPLSSKSKFIGELRSLDSVKDWRKIEREVNLCEPLYAAGQEMDGATRQLKGRLAIRNRQQLRNLINQLLDGERGFSYLISNSLKNLASMADNSKTSYAEKRKAVRDDIRHELMAHELKNRTILNPKASKPPWYKRLFR